MSDSNELYRGFLSDVGENGLEIEATHVENLNTGEYWLALTIYDGEHIYQIKALPIFKEEDDEDFEEDTFRGF